MSIIAWIVLGLAAGLIAWLTAIAGAASLLLAYHLISGTSPSRHGWFAHR